MKIISQRTSFALMLALRTFKLQGSPINLYPDYLSLHAIHFLRSCTSSGRLFTAPEWGTAYMPNFSVRTLLASW